MLWSSIRMDNVDRSKPVCIYQQEFRRAWSGRNRVAEKTKLQRGVIEFGGVQKE